MLVGVIIFGKSPEEGIIRRVFFQTYYYLFTHTALSWMSVDTCIGFHGFIGSSKRERTAQCKEDPRGEARSRL